MKWINRCFYLLIKKIIQWYEKMAANDLSAKIVLGENSHVICPSHPRRIVNCQTPDKLCTEVSHPLKGGFRM